MNEQTKMIYVCSPLRGDMEANMEKARGYCRKITMQYPDVVPMAPHIYCTQFIDDTKNDERAIGLNMGLYLLGLCSEMWIFGMDKPSEGMKGEIALAKAKGIRIKDGFKMIS